MFLLHEINLPVDCRADINVYEASSAKHDISIECAFATTVDLMSDEHLYGDLHDTLFHHEDDASIFASNGDAIALMPHQQTPPTSMDDLKRQVSQLSQKYSVSD